jgi:hypothetical protein
MSMLWEANLKERVALGLVPGWEIFRKFGMNNDVPNTGSEEVWPPGTARTLPSAAAVVAVSSDSAEDDPDEATPPGTGAWTMRIEGLDANYKEITEDVTLTGTTPVNTVASFLRINRMYINTAGSTEGNVGNISATIGGNLQAYIEATEGQTHQTHYTVPAGHTLLVTGLTVGVGRMGGTSDCQVATQIKLTGVVGADAAWRTISDVYIYNGEIHQNNETATVIPQKTETRQVVTSSAATQVYSIAQGFLIRDTSDYQV